MKLSVRVPGTLSNLGPGFDVLGLAISLENLFEFELLPGPTAFFSEGEEIDAAAHVSFQTLLRANERFGTTFSGKLSLRQQEAIPRSRGLGSSAAARVAGLVAWAKITGAEPELRELIDLLTEEEGHPDNAVPALVGGLTICARDGASVRHLRLEPPAMQIALCIPERMVETDRARAALPMSYPREVVVHNLSRLAHLLIGLTQEDVAALAFGSSDLVHEPYRKPLIGPVDPALAAARRHGAHAAFISGSGSTLAALVLGAEPGAQDIAEAMAEVFRASGMRCTALTAVPRSQGAWPCQG